MTEVEFKLEARLRAIEWSLAGAMVAIIARSAPDAVSFVERMTTSLAQVAQSQTFPELADAAQSDMMSAEFEAAVARLGEMQKSLAEALGRL